MDSGPSSILFQISLILVLILLNAFFAASEIAIVSVNKSKLTLLANEGNIKAKLLLTLIDEPSKFLATIQVGITLGGFFASASAATSLSKPLSNVLQNLSIPASNEIAIVTVTIILSYVTLVLGELFPKRLALQNAESIAMFSIRPILFISKITSPFIKILTLSTNLLVRIVGIDDTNLDEKVSIEEIRMMINVGEENGVINEIEKEMIDGIFKFDDTLAKEIMTPKINVFAIDIKTPIDEMLSKISEEQYSRIPVYEESIDNIIGVLYMKDLFVKSQKETLTQKSIRELLREPYFVPETKNIDELFNEMQSTNTHMSLLIDEYGAFNGIVTIEDLIEEVMGNIFDEYDENNDSIVQTDPYVYLVDGLTSIDDVNESLHLNLPSDIFDTIGGFVVNLLGYIPDLNENRTLEYENILFKIEKVGEKRIDKIKVLLNQNTDDRIEQFEEKSSKKIMNLIENLD